MKWLAALALTFFLGTTGFVSVHNVVHHEDEPVAALPPSGTRSGGSANGTPAAVESRKAKVPLTMGASSVSDIADGRHEAAQLAVTKGGGSASTDSTSRGVEVSARSAGAGGRSVWFGLIGSDLTITKGGAARATAVIRMDGISWHGTMSSDGGTASVELRLQVQNQRGDQLGNVVIDQQSIARPGSVELSGTNKSVTVEVAVEEAPEVLRAYLYAKADAAGGSGGTAVNLAGTIAGRAAGVSYASIAIAIGAPPPPTTLPVAAPAVGTGISAAHLAAHASAENCWLLIDGRVYDMSTYLRKHPGSQAPVLKVCGRDATEAFLSQGGRGSRHSYAAIDKMDALFIGNYAG